MLIGPDIIVLDIQQLPGLNGLQALEKSSPDYRFRAVFSTAYDYF